MNETYALGNLIAAYAGMALTLLVHLIAFRLRCRGERRRRELEEEREWRLLHLHPRDTTSAS